MALRKAELKEILSEAGCDAERIAEACQKILDGHVATVDALKEQITELQTQVKSFEADHQELEDLRKNNGDITALRQEYDDFKKQVESDKIKAKKESAYREILKDANVPERYFSRILKYSGDEIDGIEFDEDGKIKGAQEILQKVKTEWSDYTESSHTEGVKTPTPPANTGAKTTMTKEQIRSISDPVARQKAMMENPSLFGLPESD